LVAARVRAQLNLLYWPALRFAARKLVDPSYQYRLGTRFEDYPLLRVKALICGGSMVQINRIPRVKLRELTLVTCVK
jgi:hypothetical protein